VQDGGERQGGRRHAGAAGRAPMGGNPAIARRKWMENRRFVAAAGL